MKFGHSLSSYVEKTLPDWRDKFLSYKDLKKRLNLIEPKPETGDRPERRLGFGDRTMTDAELGFVRLLDGEIEKFNWFFREKEEIYVIRLKDFADRVAKAGDRGDELMRIAKQMVDFHGEMVLLENYSSLNYIGLMKILKKYDKRTGGLLRMIFMQKVSEQPFFITDLLEKLVNDCGSMLSQLFPERESGEAVEIEYMESLYLQNVVSAIRALKQIRSRSSTVSDFSLPPLNMNGFNGYGMT